MEKITVIPGEVEESDHESVKVTNRDPSVRAGPAVSLGMTIFVGCS